MDQLNRASHIVSFAILSFLTLSTAAFGQALPDGKGKAEFERVCSNCHTAAMATRLRNTPEGWKSVVNDMVSRGAQGSQADIDNVVLYLSTNFGPDRSGAKSSPMPVATPFTPARTTTTITLSSSEIGDAKRVIAENGCVTCHRVGNEGSYIGPDLNDVGTRRKADEIRASIVSPQPTVQPENREVRLVKRDGKTIVGRILNQDGYSVQMIDATGQLATYSKSGLREFTIVDANPMPPFGNKIAGHDLDNLARYLSSLTKPGK
jgi:putative heme-binding domain-containing protein